MRLIDAAFDLFFWPFRAANPLYGLTAISVLTGLGAVLVFRYVSNQAALRRIKNRIQAHLLELRLFPDQLGAVSRAHGRILRWTAVYLAYNLKPLAVLLVPLVIVMVQLDLRYGRTPLAKDHSFLLTANLSQPLALDSVSLQLPKGLTLTAPPVNIPSLGEVDWRIRADKYGVFWPAVVVAGETFTKQVVVSKQITALPVERAQAGLVAWLSNPLEPALPSRSRLRSLEVNYAPRSLDLGFLATNWLVFFLVVSLVAGSTLKLALRIEI